MGQRATKNIVIDQNDASRDLIKIRESIKLLKIFLGLYRIFFKVIIIIIYLLRDHYLSAGDGVKGNKVDSKENEVEVEDDCRQQIHERVLVFSLDFEKGPYLIKLEEADQDNEDESVEENEEHDVEAGVRGSEDDYYVEVAAYRVEEGGRV